MAIQINYSVNNRNVFSEIGYYNNNVWTHLAYPSSEGNTIIYLPEDVNLNEEITLYFASEYDRKNNPTYEIYSITTRTNCTIVKQDQFSLTLTFQSEEATLTLHTYRMDYIAGSHTFYDTCTWFDNADGLDNQNYLFSINANNSGTSYSSITISPGTLHDGSQTTAMLVYSSGHGDYLYASGQLNESCKKIDFGTTPQSVPRVLSQWINENSTVSSYGFTVNGDHFTWTGEQDDGTPVSSSLVKAGYKVTLTFDLDENYQINDITGTYVNGTTVNLPITKVEDNIYSFIMPAAAVTINVDTGLREDIDLPINLTYSINGKQDSTLYARANVGGGYTVIGSNGIGTVYSKINERLWIYICDPYTVDENPPEKLYRIEATGCKIERPPNEDYRFIASFTDLEASLHIDAYENSTISGGHTFNNTCTFFGSDLNRTYYFDQQYLFVGTTRYTGFRITTGDTSSSSNTTVELIRAEDGHVDSLYTNGVLNTTYRTINFGTFTQNIPTILKNWIKQNTTKAKYSINFELTNCTVDIDGTKYYPNDEVVFTLKPNFGYTLDYGTVRFRLLQVTESGIVESDVLDIDPPIGGKYTLIMPAGTLTVIATATANSLQTYGVSCTVYCNNRAGFSNLEIYNANQTYTQFFTGSDGTATSSQKTITVNSANTYQGRLTLTPGWELSSANAISGCSVTKTSSNTFNVKFNDFNASLQVVTNQVEVPVVEYDINYHYTNATLSNTVSSAEANTIVSFTVTPSSGYQVDSVIAKRTDNNRNISVSQSGSTYSFTMPDSDVTVNVYTTQEEPEPEPTIYSIDYNYSNVKLSNAIYNSEANRTVSFTVTPSSGYQIDSITAKRTNGNNISVTKSGSTYSFTMPDSDVIVTIVSSLIPTYTSILTLTFDNNISSIRANIKGNQYTWSQSGEFYTISHDINTNYVFTVTFNNSNYKIDNIGANNCFASSTNDNQFYVSFSSSATCSIDVSSTTTESSSTVTGDSSGIPFWSPIAAKKIVDRDNDRSLLSSSGSSTVVGNTNTTLRLNMRNLSLNGSTGTKGSLLQSGGTSTASWRSVEDSTGASALNGSSNAIPTVRDIYHGLPSINGTHSYTSNNSIYAPTTGGTRGYILQSMGSEPPVWISRSSTTWTQKYLHIIKLVGWRSENAKPAECAIEWFVDSDKNIRCSSLSDLYQLMATTTYDCFGFGTDSINYSTTTNVMWTRVQLQNSTSIKITGIQMSSSVATYKNIILQNNSESKINLIDDMIIPYISTASSITSSNKDYNVTLTTQGEFQSILIYVPSTGQTYTFDSSNTNYTINAGENETLILTIEKRTSPGADRWGIDTVTGTGANIYNISETQCDLILTEETVNITINARSYEHLITAITNNASCYINNKGIGIANTYKEGEVLELKVVPEEGYTISAVTATISTGEVELIYLRTENINTMIYSFTMPSEDVTITATTN